MYYIKFYFSSNFGAVFFFLIDWVESFQEYFDGFPLSLTVTEINSTEIVQQKPNSKIETFFFFHPILNAVFFAFFFYGPSITLMTLYG